MKAFITGIGGQTGSYLTEQLLAKGYEVHGLVRRSSSGYDNLRNIIHLVRDESVYRSRLFLHAGDMADGSSLHRIISEVKPDLVFNLAAQADVQESFLMPEYSLDINGTGVMRLLEAVRQHAPMAHVYQASTSELFGAAVTVPQRETTPFNPQSPYGIGKLAGFYAAKKYREIYGMHISNGILFNHESPRRGLDYLTRKVTNAVARIKLGKQRNVRLGNLAAKRDWGYAPNFAEAAFLMTQQATPGDFVVGTGETHTVQEWVEAAFARAGLIWSDHVIIDQKLFRAAEVDILQADASRAEALLDWRPTHKFKDLVELMVDADLEKESLTKL